MGNRFNGFIVCNVLFPIFILFYLIYLYKKMGIKSYENLLVDEVKDKIAVLLGKTGVG